MLTQDQINKIILALLAINTAMMIYCCVKSSSEEYVDIRTKKPSTVSSGATQAKPRA